FNEPQEDFSDDIIDIFKSYAKFVKKIKITFREIDEKGAALYKLYQLYQIGSTARYISDF
ncbi:hypothetical protein H109_07176, partial [Trichophyton interdigitale MR816]